MSNIGSYAVVFIILFIIIFGLIKRIPVFDIFVDGARQGINSSLSILPSLVGLICAISMFKTSGALDLLANFVSPVMSFFQIPEQLLPLMLLRPVSGSGSIALCDNIFSEYGPDSLIGRMACVMMGSTETTFYAITVYFGSVGIKKTRHTIIAALLADMTGYIVSVILINLSFFS
ncbi:MAG: spore maturation protein [Clostridia bacterium]|nr:spore maturation protein [Clostridia bacterium]